MEQVKQLSGFYEAIADDPRIGTTHISLYMALFQYWNLNSFENPISITRQEVMVLAKISGNATYHKCMKDLVECGYIDYVPSFNPVLRSLVWVRGG